jgi:Na+/proline symporter
VSAVVVTSERLLASGGSAFGAGFIAFLIVLALIVASFFLFRSMSRHLRKVPSSFDVPPVDEDAK